MTIKVLHLSTYAGGGGAARAAANVNIALQRTGVSSRMVTAHGNRFRVARVADRALWRLQQSSTQTWRSPARFGSLTAKAINESPADVVNLHWVTDGFLSIEEIGKIEKPVFMSMYDMWPFSGTEHYCIDSPEARWRHGYSIDNRQVDEVGLDLDRWTWERKLNMWQEFHMVPASSWLERATRASALCSHWPISRIPHPVDERVFYPIDKDAARDVLKIQRNQPIISFISSGGVTDSRKGFDLLVKAFRIIREHIPKVRILVVGPPPNAQVPRDIAIDVMGEVRDDETLNLVYNASDCVTVPSRQDNLPLTAMEAQMCGRPVVGFAVGGLSEVVEHQSSGFLALPFDHEEMAMGISTILDDPVLQTDWGYAARAQAVEKWSFHRIGRQYESVYAAST